MDKGKYIIVDMIAYEIAVMFDNTISHIDFVEMFPKERIVAAGFFAVQADSSTADPGGIWVDAFGKSTTLKIESRGDKDEKLIKRVLRKDDY
jgi:hypothetical protein